MRIKEIRLSKTSSSLGLADTSTTVFDSGAAINGEILQVEWRANRTGSLAVSVSGTGEEVWRRNAPSGTGTQFTRPALFTEHFTTGSIADAEHVPFIVNGPIVLDTTAVTSGTQVYDVVVRYR
jgi:hypothetical protein